MSYLRSILLLLFAFQICPFDASAQTTEGTLKANNHCREFPDGGARTYRKFQVPVPAFHKACGLTKSCILKLER